MPQVEFPCPQCGQRLTAGADADGSSIQCPRCSIHVLVPEDHAAADEPSGAARAPGRQPEARPELIGEPPELWPEEAASTPASQDVPAWSGPPDAALAESEAQPGEPAPSAPAGPARSSAAGSGETKSCDVCSATVRLEAKRCIHCGHQFRQERPAGASDPAGGGLSESTSRKTRYKRQHQTAELDRKARVRRIFGWVFVVPAALFGAILIFALASGLKENNAQESGGFWMIVCVFGAMVAVPGIISLFCFRSATTTKREAARLRRVE